MFTKIRNGIFLFLVVFILISTSTYKTFKANRGEITKRITV